MVMISLWESLGFEQVLEYLFVREIGHPTVVARKVVGLLLVGVEMRQSQATTREKPLTLQYK
jgi:hypothetical protein